MSPYSLYEIDGVYRVLGGTTSLKVHKFGITKVGPSRPESQITPCRTTMQAPLCTLKFIRRGIRGWRRARQLEAVYALRYKLVHGTCPPGMLRCL